MPYEADIGAGGPAVLDIDVTGMTVGQYLVHLNHVLAEATIIGLLSGSTSLRLRHVDRISPADGPSDCLRVPPDRVEHEKSRTHQIGWKVGLAARPARVGRSRTPNVTKNCTVTLTVTDNKNRTGRTSRQVRCVKNIAEPLCFAS